MTNGEPVEKPPNREPSEAPAPSQPNPPLRAVHTPNFPELFAG